MTSSPKINRCETVSKLCLTILKPPILYSAKCIPNELRLNLDIPPGNTNFLCWSLMNESNKSMAGNFILHSGQDGSARSDLTQHNKHGRQKLCPQDKYIDAEWLPKHMLHMQWAPILYGTVTFPLGSSIYSCESGILCLLLSMGDWIFDVIQYEVKD